MSGKSTENLFVKIKFGVVKSVEKSKMLRSNKESCTIKHIKN